MSQTISEFSFWESTEPVFGLDLGSAQKTLSEDEASRLFNALGAFLREPTATLGVDEYTVRERWRDLQNQGRVKGNLDVAQAREALYAALDSYSIDTNETIERIDVYLLETARAHQGEL